jgi:predicted phosphodiesterase
MMRIAVISDVHGNIEALEAVLADIATRGVDLIVNLGDVLSGPLFPVECADRLMPLDLPTIRGNHERQLLTLEHGDMGLSDQYTASCLAPNHLTWIAGLPESLRPFDDVILVHGTPHSDVAYFLESVDAKGWRPASMEEVTLRAVAASANLTLCGHSHLQRSVSLADGRLIVNPGSVGLPAYEAGRPYPHKMQSGSPHARYAIVEKTNHRWAAEMMAIDYDWESMAAVAEKQGRPDWAQALRTGYV